MGPSFETRPSAAPQDEDTRYLQRREVDRLVAVEGATLWRQEKAILPGQFIWGYAGIPPGVADLDGDGLDELISLYPVCFWVADGRTGKLKNGVELASQKKLSAWAAYGEPMVRRFTGKPEAEVLLDSIGAVTGMPEKFAGLPAGTRAIQLPDAGGDVGRHAVQLFRGPVHAALADDGTKDQQGFEVDRSHGENDSPYLFIGQRAPVAF